MPVLASDHKVHRDADKRPIGPASSVTNEKHTGGSHAGILVAMVESRPKKSTTVIFETDSEVLQKQKSDFARRLVDNIKNFQPYGDESK